MSRPPDAPLVVIDVQTRLEFTFADLMRFHGPRSPGGVAHAFKVLERALPELAVDGPPERRAITVRTAFGGPGARDGFELVTRAVSDDRYVVDPALRQPQLGAARERFVFELVAGGRSVTLQLREGFVTDEFAGLAFAAERTASEQERLEVLKPQLAERVMAAPAAAVYDLSRGA